MAVTSIPPTVDIFCRMVEARSREHHQAMRLALNNGWLAIAGSVLRMELDSMIRVVYLQSAGDRRRQILASCVAGEGFRDGNRRISDREMVGVAAACNGWVAAVYDFGNNFVHLTNAHNYAAADPFQVYDGRTDVVRYLNRYHHGKVGGRPLDDNSTLRDVASYAPHVLDKVTTNVDIYVNDLRAQS